MGAYFEPIEAISREQALEDWEKEEQSSGHVPDVNALDRLEQHKQRTDWRYFSGSLTEDGVKELILPYHVHGKYGVAEGGQSFADAVTGNLRPFQEKQIDDCIERLLRVASDISDLFTQSGNLLDVDYVLGRIYDNPELAMHGHYGDHGENKLYVGNIHRFLAYGLWISEVGYHPMKVVYCRFL